MASDFALGQFRFLATLLLIHGQQSYRRISLVIGYATVLCTVNITSHSLTGRIIH